MAWSNQNSLQSHEWQEDPLNVQIIQQPTPQSITLFQQLPPAVSSAPPIRPGHVREDLVELMMLQNAQMHQVIMNNMTMSALSNFGHIHTPELNKNPGDIMEDPEVYHHYYPTGPCLPYPAWVPLPQPQFQPAVPFLQNSQGFTEQQEPAQTEPTLHRERRAVPPPPPPSATGTVGADRPPAAEYYDATERK